MKDECSSTVAIAYDFDETLAMKNMLVYVEDVLGLDSTGFQEKLREVSKATNGDLLLICMYLLVEAGKAAGKGVTARDLRSIGACMEPFPGVMDWFERINAYGARQNIQVEHYIISSNIREILEGTPVARHMSRIYGSSFIFNEQGHACWPSLSVDYTNKTQFLFRISKGCFEESDMEGVNAKVQAIHKRVPFRNIIFVGDGETDVPCMKLVLQKGGHSFAVYNPDRPSSKELARLLEKEGRVYKALPADYRENSPMDKAVKTVIDGVAARLRLDTIGVCW